MKKLFVSLLFLLILTGCSNKKDEEEKIVPYKEIVNNELKIVNMDKEEIYLNEYKLSFDKGTSTLTCFDYIWWLLKNKVYYKFSGLSAYDCVKKVFDDLEIPYSNEGIFGGEDGEGKDIKIDHIVSGVSAYKCIMMIATELHVQLGYYYYIYMDEAGNVNITRCDKYWSRQIITTANKNDYAITDKVTGNLISGSYSNSM